MEQYLQLIVSVLAGLATAIPLAIKLVEYVRKAVKEKNWPKVVSLVIDLMSEVEGKMEVGADKKTYVLAMLKASADTIDYDLDEKDYEKIGDLIDSMCDMSKVLNANKPVATEGKKETTELSGGMQHESWRNCWMERRWLASAPYLYPDCTN